MSDSISECSLDERLKMEKQKQLEKDGHLSDNISTISGEYVFHPFPAVNCLVLVHKVFENDSLLCTNYDIQCAQANDDYDIIQWVSTASHYSCTKALVDLSKVKPFQIKRFKNKKKLKNKLNDIFDIKDYNTRQDESIKRMTIYVIHDENEQHDFVIDLLKKSQKKNNILIQKAIELIINSLEFKSNKYQLNSNKSRKSNSIFSRFRKKK